MCYFSLGEFARILTNSVHPLDAVVKFKVPSQTLSPTSKCAFNRPTNSHTTQHSNVHNTSLDEANEMRAHHKTDYGNSITTSLSVYASVDVDKFSSTKLEAASAAAENLA